MIKLPSEFFSPVSTVTLELFRYRHSIFLWNIHTFLVLSFVLVVFRIPAKIIRPIFPYALSLRFWHCISEYIMRDMGKWMPIKPRQTQQSTSILFWDALLKITQPKLKEYWIRNSSYAMCVLCRVCLILTLCSLVHLSDIKHGRPTTILDLLLNHVFQ